MKKYLCGLLTGIIICLSLTAFATSLNIIPNPYPVLINGTNTPVDGYNINDSTYLKLRDFEKAGLKVDFKNDNILVTAPTVTTTPEQTINNTEVDTVQTIENTQSSQVDTNNWVSVRDLFGKYNTKITVLGTQDKIIMEKGSMLITLEITKPYNEIKQVQTSYGNISILVKDDGAYRTIYLNINDLKVIGLID